MGNAVDGSDGGQFKAVGLRMGSRFSVVVFQQA